MSKCCYKCGRKGDIFTIKGEWDEGTNITYYYCRDEAGCEAIVQKRGGQWSAGRNEDAPSLEESYISKVKAVAWIISLILALPAAIVFSLVYKDAAMNPWVVGISTWLMTSAILVLAWGLGVLTVMLPCLAFIVIKYFSLVSSNWLWWLTIPAGLYIGIWIRVSLFDKLDKQNSFLLVLRVIGFFSLVVVVPVIMYFIRN